MIGVIGHEGDVHCVGESVRLKKDVLVVDDGVCGSTLAELGAGGS